jgi:DNA-binding FadR family transcriptional regulator
MRHIRGVSMTQRLLERLGQSIVAGTYEGRGFPTESELCTAHEASRTVTREAVKMLTAKGLLSSRPRQGTRIEPVAQWNLLDPDVVRWMTERPYSHKIYRDLCEVRLAIEPVAAGLAARRARQGDLKAMRAGFDGMREKAAHHDLALLADIDFHVAILLASGNPFFHKLRELIHTALSLSIALTNRIAGHTASLEAHEAVLIAIEAGDAAAAEGAMRAILLDSIELVESFQAAEAAE